MPEVIPTNLATITKAQDQLTLSWEDPTTKQLYQQVCRLPVAIGREVARMPA
ncbi:MAG: hypothetical protein ACK4QL_08785 [Pseudanabaenaceae cyanobacterium]